MDRRHLAHLALQRNQSLPGVALALLGDASGVGQRDVCLHLAFFRQCRSAGVARYCASGHHCDRQYNHVYRRLVDLEKPRYRDFLAPVPLHSSDLEIHKNTKTV